MKSNYHDNYNEWLSYPAVDADTKAELESIKDNEAELKERFSAMLSFGTAGLRGIMRAGLNGMNAYTVRYATQGLADVINEEGRAESGVAIAYDSRNNSSYFADTAASVLAANGIKVYLFDNLRPTPELSFALRELKTVAGVNITASHNPKEYNGYKVYWEDGAQIGAERATQIADAINAIDIFTDVKFMDYDEALKSGLITIIGEEIDKVYLERVLEQSLADDCVKAQADKIKIIYTAFHGAGYKLVPEVLKRIGIKNLVPVKEQLVIDGNFPTIPTPNPEFTSNYELAIEYAKREDADIIIGTDPDSDRCGCVVKTPHGYEALSGNEMGILMIDYVLSRRKEMGTLPKDAAVIKSVVSSSLCEKICESYGVDCIKVLTGFKNIGEKIKAFEENGDHTFVFGFEESIGFLAGTYARDKDAVFASMMVAELACYYMSKGMSVYDALNDLYARYGFCEDSSHRFSFDGYNAQGRMTDAMTAIRENSPAEIGYKVTKVQDFLGGFEGLPSSNMIRFELEEDCAVIIRPSGTEPIVKAYIKTTGKDKAEADAKKEVILSACKKLILG